MAFLSMAKLALHSRLLILRRSARGANRRIRNHLTTITIDSITAEQLEAVGAAMRAQAAIISEWLKDNNSRTFLEFARLEYQLMRLLRRSGGIQRKHRSLCGAQAAAWRP
jgi:hypothetical protein